LNEKFSLARIEKETYAKKVNQSTIQVDWLKNLKKHLESDYESKFSKKPFEEQGITR